MLDWLLGLGSHAPKPKAKHLDDVVDRLLGSSHLDGEDAFPLSEKELKRLCSSTRLVGGRRGRAARDRSSPRPLRQCRRSAAAAWAVLFGCQGRPSCCCAAPLAPQPASTMVCLHAGMRCSRSPRCWRSGPRAT